METITLDALTNRQIFYHVNGFYQSFSGDGVWNFREKGRTKNGLMLVLARKVTFTLSNGRELCFPYGTVVSLPKGARYSVSFFGCESYSDILVNFGLRDFSGHEYCFGEEIFALVSAATPAIVNGFQRIANADDNMKRPYLQRYKSFYSLLEEINAAHTLEQESADRRSVTPALLYLDHHISDKVDIPGLARLCLMSYSTFRREFKQKTGMSPSQYRLKGKIEKACELLVTCPERTVNDIAFSLGFYDPPCFTKAFVAVTGKTPKKWRSEH